MPAEASSRVPFELAGRRVWVAGHRGMVGGALVRRLSSEGCEIITACRAELDLRRQAEVESWVGRTRPEVIFLAAAKVGGILANDRYPVDFLYENLVIETNIIRAAYETGVRKLMFLGSSCIYPRLAAQPIREEALLTGPLEPTNEWYAVAKIAGLKLCQAYRQQHGADFISAMPTNLFGPGDNYEPSGSHVMAALIRKAHEAKIEGRGAIEVWGDGTPRREFLHVDDCADALVHVMKFYSEGLHINIGSGEDLEIRELARIVCAVVGFEGGIVTDTSKPNGTPRKLLDGSRLAALGWQPRLTLREGIALAYEAFKREQSVQ